MAKTKKLAKKKMAATDKNKMPMSKKMAKTSKKK